MCKLVTVRLPVIITTTYGFPSMFRASQLTEPVWSALSRRYIVEVRYNGITYRVGVESISD